MVSLFLRYMVYRKNVGNIFEIKIKAKMGKVKSKCEKN